MDARKIYKKVTIYLSLLSAALLALAIYFGLQPNITNRPHSLPPINGLILPQAQSIADFKLTDQDGNPFTKTNMQGHWTLMFFGFTNCGMVCPTTLAALNKMYGILAKDLSASKLPLVVMVSVDPERDSVTRLKEYMMAFNPHFMGVTGELPTISNLEKQLHIVAVKLQTEGSKAQYTINHSAEIMIFDPTAHLRAFFSYPHQAEQMAKDYKAILNVE